MMINAGIVGGSGYVGNVLTKLLSNHKKVKLKIITRNPKTKDNSDSFDKLDYSKLNNLDIVFLALRHGTAKNIAQKIKCKIIDLSSDHRQTETYGLPEIFSEKIKKSRFVANPGCYATACILSAYPINDLVKYAVFDCISGYSGGGKNHGYNYENNIITYKLTNHQHINEISNLINFKFSFTPHVVNAFSGLMCTAHILLKAKITKKEIMKKYKTFYKNTMTKVVDAIPCTKNVAEKPYCLLGGFEIDKNNQLVVISVIDNLYKGAASQAIENMNIMFGLKNYEGLV